jgi:hypothetical protein
MSATSREWKHLERRPGSSYRQLCVKGKRIWAWTLYCEFMSEKEPRTPSGSQAIEYCQADPPEIREDQRKDDLLAEAIGMNDPGYKFRGKPRPLSTEERVRLGL